jgi:hypothetical protein
MLSDSNCKFVRFLLSNFYFFGSEAPGFFFNFCLRTYWRASSRAWDLGFATCNEKLGSAELLCCLRGVSFRPPDLDSAVCATFA